MEIGDKIRRARIQRKLSLRKLAALIGVTGSAVHQWENGNVTNITLTNRLALSEHLSLPIAELLPPEATAGEVTTRDPREIAMLGKFREAPEPRREAYFRLLLVMEEEAEEAGRSGSTQQPPRP